MESIKGGGWGVKCIDWRVVRGNDPPTRPSMEEMLLPPLSKMVSHSQKIPGHTDQILFREHFELNSFIKFCSFER